MSRAKNIEKIEDTLPSSTVKIHFQCPVCSKTAHLEIKRESFEQSDGLTTVSVPKEVICVHGFHAFVDKNYKIRGYQRVDFEVKRDPKLEKKTVNNQMKSDAEVEEGKKPKDINFEQIILNKNKLMYYPNVPQKNKEGQKDILKKIYEEFWEFIPNDNERFREYIENDKRRIHFIS